jgi:hypothetical protein
MHNRSGGVVGFKRPMSAFGGKADIGLTLPNVCLPKADIGISKLLLCKLTSEPHSAGRKSLL